MSPEYVRLVEVTPSQDLLSAAVYTAHGDFSLGYRAADVIVMKVEDIPVLRKLLDRVEQAAKR